MRYLFSFLVLAFLLSSSGCCLVERSDDSGEKSFVIPSSLKGYVLVLDETKAERSIRHGFNKPSDPRPIEEARWERVAPKHKGFSRELFRDPDHADMWREARILYGVQWLVLQPLAREERIVIDLVYDRTGKHTADLKFITDIEGAYDTRDEWTFHLSFDSPLSGTVKYRYRCWEYEYEYRNVAFRLVPYRELIGKLPYGQKKE